MKLRKAALLAFAAALTAVLTACSSATPTATAPVNTPTPFTGAGIFTPEVRKSAATDTDGVRGAWGRMARWDAGLSWSIEFPERGEWQFVRTVTTAGNELIEARRLDGEDVPFQVVRLELGPDAEELLPDNYDCGATLRTVLNSGGVASSDRLPDTEPGGIPARMSKIRVIEPPGSSGHILAVCMVTADYLYMAAGHAPDESDEQDVLTMLRSFRVQV